MDNFHIDVTGVGDGNLALALRLAFSQHKSAVMYEEHKGALVLYWTDYQDPAVKRLPFKLTVDNVTPFVANWLAEQPYGEQPDHDGDNGKGWRVYNEAWGHIGNRWQAFVAIKPAWAMYGK